MIIWVVQFSSGDTKLEKKLPKNQHTKRKLLNFENWCNGVLSVFVFCFVFPEKGPGIVPEPGNFFPFHALYVGVFVLLNVSCSSL